MNTHTGCLQVAEPENYGQKGKKAREAGGDSAGRRNKPPRETGTYSITNFFNRVQESPRKAGVAGPSCPLPASASAAALSGARQGPDASRDWRGDRQAGGGVEGSAPSSGGGGPHLRPDTWLGAGMGPRHAATTKGQGSINQMLQSVPSGSREMASLEATADVREDPGGGSSASLRRPSDNREGQASKRAKQDPAGDREGRGDPGDRGPEKDAMRRLLAEAAMRRMGTLSEPAGSSSRGPRGLQDQCLGGQPVRAAGLEKSRAMGAGGVGDEQFGVSEESGQNLPVGGNVACAVREGLHQASLLRGGDGGVGTIGTREEGVAGHQGVCAGVLGGVSGRGESVHVVPGPPHVVPGHRQQETATEEDEDARKRWPRTFVNVRRSSTSSSVIDLVSSDDEM